MPLTDPAVPRPLVVTGRPDWRDAVVRLCAGAGVDPVVCAEVSTARSHWGRASVVMLGEDLLAPVAEQPLERRADVFVVADDDPSPATWSRALAVGAQSVVSLPRDDEVLGVVLVDRADGVPRDAPVLVVTGGCGGVGASSLAAAVAMTASRDPQVRPGGVLLLDGDPWGGGLDVLLGEERTAGLRWRDLVSTDGHLSGSALQRSIPHVGSLGVLSWHRDAHTQAPPGVARSVLLAARRVHELVVVDLPRHPDPFGDVVLPLAGRVVVVAPDDVRGVGASSAVVARLGLRRDDTAVVVRRRRGGLPPDLVAETLDVPLLGTVVDDRRFRRAVEEGLGPLGRRTAVRAAAQRLWQRLATDLD